MLREDDTSAHDFRKTLELEPGFRGADGRAAGGHSKGAVEFSAAKSVSDTSDA